MTDEPEWVPISGASWPVKPGGKIRRRGLEFGILEVDKRRALTVSLDDGDSWILNRRQAGGWEVLRGD